MKVTGGCHCGKVRFSVETVQSPELLDCNCAICSQTGHIHLFIAHEDFQLESGADSLISYRFGTMQAEHLFCKQCGIKSFYQPRSHPTAWSVNFNCLDQGHGITPKIVPFDGRNWEQAKAEISDT